MRTGRMIVLFFLCTFSILASEAQDDARIWAKQIADSMKSVRTIQCDFVQTKKLNVLDHVLTIKGILCADRIGKIAWHVIDPMPYSCILVDDHLTQWDADTNRENTVSVKIHPALTVFAENMKAFCSGDIRPLIRKYNISIPQKGVLEFKPKKDTAAAKIFSRIELIPSSDESYIRSVSIYELNGDVSTITFCNVRQNIAISPSLWRVQSK